MDYNQDIFFKMQQQQMPGKQPFYMTNPIQNLYMTELEYQRDLDVSAGDKKSAGAGGRRMR